MSLVRSAQSLDLVRHAYETNGELVKGLFQLRKGQKELIEGLAESSQVAQAAVVRTIIDEWCEMKLAAEGKSV